MLTIPAEEKARLLSLLDAAYEKHRALLQEIDSAALVQTPLGKEAAVAVGARRSNIDFFFENLVPADAYSVVAAPVYYDYQALGSLRLGDDHRLRVMAYGSRDSIRLLFAKPVLEDPGLRGEIKGVLSFHRVNATLESTPTSEWSQRLSLTAGTLTRSQRIGPLMQELESVQLLGRVDQKLVLGPAADLFFGIDTDIELADGRYHGPRPPAPEGDPSMNDGLGLTESMSIRDRVEVIQPAAFVELALRPDRRVTLVPGVRFDWYGNLGKGSIDPRLSARFALGETTLKGGVGLFTQPPVWYYALPTLGNPDLDPYHALHGSAGVEQQLRDVVELGRVAAPGGDGGQDVAHVLAEDAAVEQLLASPHPLSVAAHGVDLAVVRQEAERLGQLPGREGVRAEALVHHRQRADRAGVLEIPVELCELMREEQAFVDQRPTRQARDVEGVAARDVALADGALCPLADHEQLALEARLVLRGRADQHLQDQRRALAGDGAQRRLVHRHRSPAEQALPGAEDLVLEDLLAARPIRRVARQEHAADAVFSRLGQLQACGHLGRQELVRDLEQNAGAVARLRIAAGRPAVLEVQQDADPALDDIVRAHAPQVGDEAHTAGVVLEARVVEAAGAG